MQNADSRLNFEDEHPGDFVHFTTEDGFMKGSGRLDECVWCEAPANWFNKALGLYFCCRECCTLYMAKEATRQP